MATGGIPTEPGGAHARGPPVRRATRAEYRRRSGTHRKGDTPRRSDRTRTQSRDCGEVRARSIGAVTCGAYRCGGIPRKFGAGTGNMRRFACDCGALMRRRSSASEGRFGEAEPEGCASIRVIAPYHASRWRYIESHHSRAAGTAALHLSTKTRKASARIRCPSAMCGRLPEGAEGTCPWTQAH